MTDADEVLAVYSPTLAALYARREVSSEDEAAWLAVRKTGVTATDMVKLRTGSGAAFATLRKAKRAKKERGFSTKETRFGHMREPIIAEWAARRFNVQPNTWLYGHGDQPRHMATPDGVGVDYNDRLMIAEIKTCGPDIDLTPGPVDKDGFLILARANRTGYFWRKAHYYEQLQWEMYVTGADRALFIWEQHDASWPMPRPLTMEPRWCWIARDEEFIAEQVKIANAFLADVDDLGDADPEAADYEWLVHEYLRATRKAEEWTAKAAEAKADIDRLVGDAERFSVSTTEATVSLVQEKPSLRFDEALWAKKAPKAHAAYKAARARYTKEVAGRRYLRITPHKKDEETGDE